MERLLIAVTGAVGAGKTSFIRAVSEIDPVSTERRSTDATDKEMTTVALDFGRLTINADQVVYLYGTPGQLRFEFMWDIIINKVHAYVLLVDAHRPQDFRQARRIYQFMQHRATLPMLVGLTHTDCKGAWESEDIALALGLEDYPAMMMVNASHADSVAHCLIVLLELMQTYKPSAL